MTWARIEIETVSNQLTVTIFYEINCYAIRVFEVIM